jgi:hypothetical protein
VICARGRAGFAERSIPFGTRNKLLQDSAIVSPR